MNLTNEQTSSVALVALASITIYNESMPTRAQLRTGNPTDVRLRKDLNHAEIWCGSLTLGLAALIALLVKTPMALWVGVFSALGLTLAHEIAFYSGGNHA